MNQYRVPTLADIYADDETAYKNDEFQRLLNSDPPAHWIKTHKQTGIRYLPVDKVEILLDRIYVGRWRREILTVQLLVNAIQVTVRLWVFHPVRQEWTFHDGAGAMSIQLKSGSAPSDLANINHNSIQMNTPAAVSYALKDAADNLGKIFGRDITRKDTAPYQPAFLADPYSNEETKTQQQEIISLLPPPPPSLPNHLQNLTQGFDGPPVGNVFIQPTASQATFNQQAGRAQYPGTDRQPVAVETTNQAHQPQNNAFNANMFAPVQQTQQVAAASNQSIVF